MDKPPKNPEWPPEPPPPPGPPGWIGLEPHTRDTIDWHFWRMTMVIWIIIGIAIAVTAILLR